MTTSMKKHKIIDIVLAVCLVLSAIIGAYGIITTGDCGHASTQPGLNKP